MQDLFETPRSLHMAPAPLDQYRRAVEALRDQGVRFCLLRDRLDGAQALKDMDILVHPDDRERAFRGLAIAGFHGARSRCRHRFKATWFALSDTGMCKVDLHWKPVQNGLVYYDEDAVLSRTVQRDGAPVPCPEDQLVLLLVHNIVGKAMIQAKHLPLIRALLEEPLDLRRTKAPLGQFGIQDEIHHLVWHLDDYIADPRRCRAARRRLMRKLLLANRTAWPVLLRAQIAARWPNFHFRRRGTLLALIGPDGTGKSTLARAVSTKLSVAFNQEAHVVYMGPWSHHRLRLARTICRSPTADRSFSHFCNELWRTARAQSAVRQYPVAERLRLLWKALRSNDHGHLSERENAIRQAYSEGSVAYTAGKYLYHHLRNQVDFTVLSIDLWWRYLRIWYLLHRGSHVITDRYVYDLLSGASRRVNHQRALLANAFCRLYPRPDAMYLLRLAPRQIVRRTTDLDGAGARIMLAFFEGVTERYGGHTLAADKSPAALSDEIIKENLPAMTSRLRLS
jgi:thymidylate kinase